MRYISELRDGDMISEVYLCKKKDMQKTKAGKTYCSMQMQDKTGIIDAKIWELGSGIEYFEALDFIKVDAQINTFQGNLQMNIKRVVRMQEGEFDLEEYMPCSEKNVDDMYKELMDILSTVKEPHLRKLLHSFFVEDADIKKAFVKGSAAKSIHHGFVGGLLEHSLAVTKLCQFYSTVYDVLNYDLLITAAVLHDIGKIKEISSFPENDYTDQGQLLGHIVMGTMMIDERIQKIEGFPEKLKSELEHCILAHHDKLEFGSPKRPALIEAVALAHADDTDAKIQTFKEAVQNEANPGAWSNYNRLFEGNIRRTSEQGSLND